MKTEAKAQHTPGPWRITNDAHGDVLVSTQNYMPIAEKVRTLADARLIAGAPELNHVLKELGIEFTGRLKSGIGCDPDDLKRYLDAIEPVLAKAEGVK